MPELMPKSKITILLCLLAVGLSSAQDFDRAHTTASTDGVLTFADTLHWETGPYRLDRGFGADILMTVSFENAISEGTAFFPLPVYCFDLTAANTADPADAACGWDTIAFRPASSWETRLIRPHDALIADDFTLQCGTVEFRGTHRLSGTIFPIRRHPATGEYELLTSFRLRAGVYGNGTADRARTGTGSPEKNIRTASMLSYGPTLRVGVATSGIYRITYEDLRREGLLQSAVPSDRIALYGNRAGPLPTLNTADIYDDLTDLPIAMYDGGDGRFDPGDYFLFYGQSPVVWLYEPDANASLPAFTHRQHTYSDRTYYFIGTNHPQPAARIADAPRQEIAGNETDLTRFPDYHCQAQDLYNIV
nr:hypothetical protein [Bacteroidales bacterium]